MTFTPYVPRRPAASRFAELRGLRHHVLEWGDAALASPERPTLVMLHGWMDVGASFQFVIDAMAEERHIVSMDWRGFGLTEWPATDSYWFADYLGDLDALLEHLDPAGPVDLLGHSMGGNIVSMYAGIRPARIRRLVNLEGFGLPASRPETAPDTYAHWLDELRQPARLRSYDSVEQVAQRLQQNNPLLRADRAAWLAGHWSRQRADGRWDILGDPAHKRRNPVQYQAQEVLACWRRITAPVLWVEGDRTDQHKRWGENYTRAEFDARLGVLANLRRHRLAPAGHMLHHDQPEALAALLEDFLV
jgi:pimeloyl-ACP methyl ester carboxylesterase